MELKDFFSADNLTLIGTILGSVVGSLFIFMKSFKKSLSKYMSNSKEDISKKSKNNQK